MRPRLREAAGSWRVALRLAVRAAVRHKPRTLLVVAMLMLPVFAGSVLALGYTYTYASPETEASWECGQADWVIDSPDPDYFAAQVPPGGATARYVHAQTVVRTGNRYSVQEYEAVDVADPLVRGRYVMRAGRAPRGADEVAVSGRLARQLGVRAGDRLGAGLPVRDRTVVGVVDLASELSYATLIAPVDQPLSASGTVHLLVKLPSGVGDWTPRPPDRENYSVGVQSRASLVSMAAHDHAVQTAGLMLVVGFAGAQVALLTGAAFAIGARRQRRELALVAAAGASRSQVRRLVLANGVLLGAVAGVLGVVLGVLTFVAVRHRVEVLLNHPLTSSAKPVPWLVLTAAFAVAVGALAAVFPARGVARAAVVDAMAEREPVSRNGNVLWLTIGLLVCAAGAATATLAAGPTGNIVTVTGGSVAILLGVTALSPVLVSVCGRTAPRLSLSLRLAVRHAARHRLRTAASVGAVCAGVAGGMAVMLFNAANSADASSWQPSLRPGQVVIPAGMPRSITEVLPTRSAAPFDTVAAQAASRYEPASGGAASGGAASGGASSGGASSGGGPPAEPSTVVAVGGADLIQAVTGSPAPAAAIATLAAGGAVVFHPEQTGILLPDGGSPIQLPVTVIPMSAYYSGLPGMVIAPATAARYHLSTRPGGVIVDTTRPPTVAELSLATSLELAAYLDSGNPTTVPPGLVLGTAPHTGRDLSAMFLVLAAVSAAVTLAASAVAVGLATAELRPDLSTLAAVGAGPRIRRRIAAAQAGLVVGLGTLMGALAGIAPAAGMVAFRRDLVWHVPWVPLVLTVLAAPALAVVGTALTTRPRLVLVRRLG